MIADSEELRESIKYSLVIGKISFVIQILLILCFSYKLMIVIRQYSNLLIKKFVYTMILFEVMFIAYAINLGIIAFSSI